MTRKIEIGQYNCPYCNQSVNNIIVESFVDTSPVGSNDKNGYQCIIAKCPNCKSLLPVNIKIIENKKVATYNTYEGSPSSD